MPVVASASTITYSVLGSAQLGLLVATLQVLASSFFFFFIFITVHVNGSHIRAVIASACVRARSLRNHPVLVLSRDSFGLFPAELFFRLRFY